MDLSKDNLKNTEFWNSINVVLPKYDIDKVKEATTVAPTWLHVGGGNIFRAFIARINQRLLNQGLADTGIIVCGTMDYENFERVYKPFDNLSIICDLKSDGNTGYEIIGNITEAIAANYDIEENIARLNEIASSPSLQIVSFTITEKGYALRDADGKLYKDAAEDMENGPSHPLTCMGFIASLLYTRFNAGAYPLALVSMDNCSHNGDKLKSSVLEIVDAWVAKGFVDNSFRHYVDDPSRIAYPWSMIDKITPRPSDEILNKLTHLGIDNLKSVKTTTGVFAAPFVNAEVPEYLVVEDLFPACFEPVHGGLAPSFAPRGPDGSALARSESSLNLDQGRWVMRSDARDDRMLVFSKKFTLAKGEEATFRYPVRVVSAGDYILPGPSVEAMYHPDLHARRAPSRISVKR